MWNATKIMELRKKHGLTQVELAGLTGVSKNYIYLLEKGVKTPSKTLQLLLNYVKRDLERNP